MYTHLQSIIQSAAGNIIYRTLYAQNYAIIKLVSFITDRESVSEPVQCCTTFCKTLENDHIDCLIHMNKRINFKENSFDTNAYWMRISQTCRPLLTEDNINSKQELDQIITYFQQKILNFTEGQNLIDFDPSINWILNKMFGNQNFIQPSTLTEYINFYVVIFKNAVVNIKTILKITGILAFGSSGILILLICIKLSSILNKYGFLNSTFDAIIQQEFNNLASSYIILCKSKEMFLKVNSLQKHQDPTGLYILCGFLNDTQRLEWLLEIYPDYKYCAAYGYMLQFYNINIPKKNIIGKLYNLIISAIYSNFMKNINSDNCLTQQWLIKNNVNWKVSLTEQDFKNDASMIVSIIMYYLKHELIYVANRDEYLIKQLEHIHKFNAGLKFTQVELNNISEAFKNASKLKFEQCSNASSSFIIHNILSKEDNFIKSMLSDEYIKEFKTKYTFEQKKFTKFISQNTVLYEDIGYMLYDYI